VRGFNCRHQVAENILVSVIYIVAIGKPERQVRKASHCGSKQQ